MIGEKLTLEVKILLVLSYVLIFGGLVFWTYRFYFTPSEVADPLVDFPAVSTEAPLFTDLEGELAEITRQLEDIEVLESTEISLDAALNALDSGEQSF